MNKENISPEVDTPTGQLPLLFVQSRREKQDKPFCLSNSLCSPYKMPPLPFGEISQKFHYHLRSLKIAQIMMANTFEQVGESLSEQHRHMYVLYDSEKQCDPDYHPCVIGEEYLENPSEPFLVCGFEIRNTDNNDHLSYSLDLAPFFKENTEHSASEINVSTIPIKPFITAVEFYNECLTEIFQTGLIIMPVEYLDPYSVFRSNDALPNVVETFEF